MKTFQMYREIRKTILRQLMDAEYGERYEIREAINLLRERSPQLFSSLEECAKNDIKMEEEIKQNIKKLYIIKGISQIVSKAFDGVSIKEDIHVYGDAFWTDVLTYAETQYHSGHSMRYTIVRDCLKSSGLA